MRKQNCVCEGGGRMIELIIVIFSFLLLPILDILYFLLTLKIKNKCKFKEVKAIIFGILTIVVIFSTMWGWLLLK